MESLHSIWDVLGACLMVFVPTVLVLALLGRAWNAIEDRFSLWRYRREGRKR